MLRTLLKPRWLLLLAVLVLIVVSFARLGLWQLSIARDDAAAQARAEAEARPLVPLEQVMTPNSPYTAEAAMRRVTATGSYDAPLGFLVPGRLLEGSPGYWVVTPLVVDATGARLPAVRGFVTDPAQVPPPPPGTVTVTGTVAPGESPGSGEGLPEGQRATIDLATLANDWPPGLYNAFVFVEDEEPTPAGQPVRIPPPQPAGDVDWRNLGYALQWWVFAGFAVFMYWRLLREDHLRGRPDPPPTLGAPEERTEPHHV